MFLLQVEGLLVPAGIKAQPVRGLLHAGARHHLQQTKYAWPLGQVYIHTHTQTHFSKSDGFSKSRRGRKDTIGKGLFYVDSCNFERSSNGNHNERLQMYNSFRKSLVSPFSGS